MVQIYEPIGVLEGCGVPLQGQHDVGSREVRFLIFNFTLARFIFTAAVAFSVRTRLDSKEGISFTEFTYQLLQAYDFQELHRSFGCTIQVGGSDQWGNILAGVDLINRIADSEQGPEARDKVYGITTPLLTNSSGLKFSKSTGTAIWLDRTLTSYQEFYQVFVPDGPLTLRYRLTLCSSLSDVQTNR
jgi:tyrosyl-tRNA synthetase